jgi:hypothetical protein
VAGYSFMYTRDSFNKCVSGSQQGSAFWRQVPNLNGPSGGGTVTIRADLSNIRGRNYNYDYDVDDYVANAEANYCILLGCAGIRNYQFGFNPNAWSPTLGVAGRAVGLTFFVQDTNTGSFQLGVGTSGAEVNVLNPNATSLGKMYALGNVAKMATRLGPFLMGQRLPSPDYGACCEAIVRQSSGGNILMLMNMVNESITRTIQLAAYETSGQNVIRYMEDARSIQVAIISAGTTADISLTIPPATTVYYVFPKNFATALQQPAISVRLADVANATDVVVRYAYDKYNLDVGNLTIDCGTGSCTLPVDRTIGPVYFRLIYRNANGAVLATSDIQTL